MGCGTPEIGSVDASSSCGGRSPAHCWSFGSRRQPVARPGGSGRAHRGRCPVALRAASFGGRIVMAKEHWIDEGIFHTKWDNSLPPALEIEPGDTVHFQTREVTNGQVTSGCPAETLTKLDFDNIYPLAGPVAVKGAQPGDALAVELLELHTMGWAWTGVIPGLGLLKEEFNQPYIYHWDLRE